MLLASKHFANPPVPSNLPLMYLFSPSLSTSTFQLSYIQILCSLVIQQYYKTFEMIPDQETFPDLSFERISSIREAKIPAGPVVSQVVSTVQICKKQNKSFINEFEVIGFLGEGAYGKVKAVERTYIDEDNNITKSIYAMKVYDRNVLAKQRFFAVDMQMIDGNQVLENELNIVKTLNDKNILRCYQIIDDPDCDKVFMIMDICDLGDLMKYSEMNEAYHRNEKVVNFFKERYNIQGDYIQNVAKIIFYQVSQGLNYLHDRNISHRDIKVDNIMVKSEERGSEVKLGDFTTARYSEDDISNQTIGTVHYKSPEQQFASEKGYSARAADIWSLGITMYLFYFEKFPFTGESELEIDIKALEQPIQFPETAPVGLVNLIKRLTMKDFNERPSIKEVLADPWFTEAQ